MKIHGKEISGPDAQVVVSPRNDGDLVFKAQAVLDYSDFDKLNPMPQPPGVMRPGGVMSYDTSDTKYNTRIDDWAKSKTHFMVLKSLEATEGLAWDTVIMAEPDTWNLYQQEMNDAGLTPGEIGRIITCVTDACGLNQEKIDEATKRFLAGQAEERERQSSQSSVLKSTPPGVPANASA